ncbi:recombinase family protein [Brevundimonas sp. TWP2-3-2]|uniref:recombinase family protein n=1 Tax=unclassified Brevundimonas TaxID=2622653 RepID=UPI003CF668ED
MSQPGRTLRCAIYTRKSTEEGLEQDYNSLHAQRDACAAYILSQTGEGWTMLPEVYDDGGFSGGNMQRPGLTRLLADVDAGLIDVVVVYKVDRLTRALTDFSRIVDVLDKAGASFVSVTQAFNTTTSMGRLTLNVLLSFAQFEREVTGERIRDKIMASKKLGMWMGGVVPLGYEAAGRTLTINEAEARTVRWIFERYLERGSVHAVMLELEAADIRSKSWTTVAGVQKGGLTMDRGAVFHILHNRIYIGEITHKGASYPGQHPAIVDRELFDAAQALLAENDLKTRAPGEARRPHKGAPLKGLIFDSAGNRMTPLKVAAAGKPIYRYYVSSPLQIGRREGVGSLPRISANLIEELIVQRLNELKLCAPIDAAPDWLAIRNLIDRVEVTSDAITLQFDEVMLDLAIRDFGPQSRIAVDRIQRKGTAPILTIPVRMVKRGGAKVAIGPDGQSAIRTTKTDPALSAALIRAEAWKRQLLSGEVASLKEIARAENVTPAYARRVIRTAFLAPDLKAAILDGRQPMGLTLEALVRTEMPLDWEDQRRLYAA